MVLGASSGFGSAVCTELAKQGYDVCGVHLDRRSTLQLAKDTIAEVEECGARALFFNLNAADQSNINEVLDALEEESGRGEVRLLFHSLAFGSLVPLVGDDEKASARASQMTMTLDVMANSLVLWTQALTWRGMLSDGARILAMTSAGGARAMKSYGMVSAAKAALEAYVRQLALELGPRGIAVNAIRAGVTDTVALRRIPGSEAMKARALELNPGGRLTEPVDVARVVSLLMGEGASWISGNVIGVDGGEDIAGG